LFSALPDVAVEELHGMGMSRRNSVIASALSSHFVICEHLVFRDSRSIKDLFPARGDVLQCCSFGIAALTASGGRVARAVAVARDCHRAILVSETTFEEFPWAGPNHALKRLTECSVGFVTDRPGNVDKLFVTLFE